MARVLVFAALPCTAYLSETADKPDAAPAGAAVWIDAARVNDSDPRGRPLWTSAPLDALTAALRDSGFIVY